MHIMSTPESDDERKSKSQLKREAAALRRIGEQLVRLSAGHLSSIPMGIELREAVLDAQQLRSRSAYRRQLQFVGKLMRSADSLAITRALERLDSEHDENLRRFHGLEQWRDRLILEGSEALTEFLDAFPSADSQHIRQLVRNARQERSSGRPPASSRKLFRYLKQLIDT